MTQPPTITGAPPAGAPPPPASEAGPDLAVILVRVLRSWWTWAAVAVVAALGLATWAAGGFAEVPEEGLPRVPAEARVALGPYDVAIQGWSISRDFESDTLEYTDGDAWLVIAAELTGSPPRSTGYKPDSVTVSSLVTTAYPRTVDADGTNVGNIHPGVTTSVLILLPVTEADAATLDALTSLPVLLTSHTYTQHVLSGEETWLRPLPRATVQVQRDDAVVPEPERDA